LRESGEEKWINKDLWRLYYILSVIYWKRWETGFDKNTFVEINSAILQKIIHSRKAKPALKVLIKIEVIETDNRYHVASHNRPGKSRGYRFKDPYNFVKFRQVKEINYSKISKHLLKSEEQAKKLEPEEKYLFDCLSRVTISHHVAADIEVTLFGTVLEENYFEDAVENIQNKRWRFSVGKITGRVFTNITNFPREVRQYLRLDERALTEVDISACQPLLLIQLYQNGEPEKEKYLQLVLSGQFYEGLDRRLAKPYGPEGRDDLKQKALTWLFDTSRPTRTKLCQSFVEMFPVLYAEILKFKEPNYLALAHRLQKDESTIVIKGAVRKIMMSSPNIPILTIHDSILTLPEYTATVVCALKEAVRLRLGVEPNIKVKHHGERPTNDNFPIYSNEELQGFMEDAKLLPGEEPLESVCDRYSGLIDIPSPRA